MAAVANNPKFAKKAGVPQSVGQEFANADKRNKDMPSYFNSSKKKPGKAVKKGYAHGGAAHAKRVMRNLDDEDYRNKKSLISQTYLKENLIYENEILKMSNYITDVVKSQKRINTDVTKKLIAIIKERGQITKTELFSANLGWGRGIKFGPYRRALLSNPNIYDIIDPIPSYCCLLYTSPSPRDS